MSHNEPGCTRPPDVDQPTDENQRSRGQVAAAVAVGGVTWAITFGVSLAFNVMTQELGEYESVASGENMGPGIGRLFRPFISAIVVCILALAPAICAAAIFLYTRSGSRWLPTVGVATGIGLFVVLLSAMV